MDVELLRKLRSLDVEIADAETYLRDLKAARRDVEEKVLDAYETDGIQSMNVDGRTYYLSGIIRANSDGDAGGTPAVAEVLRSMNLDDLVGETVNANTLSSYVREQVAALEADAALLPIDARVRAAVGDRLADVIKVAEVFSIRDTASTKQPAKRARGTRT